MGTVTIMSIWSDMAACGLLLECPREPTCLSDNC